MKRRLAHILSLGGYFALLILTVSWHAWLFPSTHFPTALVLTVTAAPMLLPLRGLLHGRARSHIWAAFLMTLYLIHGVGEAVANPPQRWLGVLEILLSLTVFFAATLVARWSAQETRESTAT